MVSGQKKMKPDVVWALDDWGISPGVNQGILELVRLGRVRSVSLLPNHPYLSQGLEELIASGVELTLHLNFTLGQPVSAASLVPSLLGSDGQFFSLGNFLWRYATGNVSEEELRTETRAQITALRKHGVSPRTLEAHHHVHLYGPLLRALAPVLKECGVEEVRKVECASNPLPFLASHLYDYSQWQTRSTRCLNSRDFNSFSRLSKKLRAAPGSCFLLHPASRDDLRELGSADTMQERKKQLQGVLRYLDSRD